MHKWGPECIHRNGDPVCIDLIGDPVCIDINGDPVGISFVLIQRNWVKRGLAKKGPLGSIIL